MTALPTHTKLTVEEFLAWAETQDGRWELFDGVPVAMATERAIHGRVKLRAANALERAIAAAGLPCQALLDCVGVRIDRHRSYQPDALVQCGAPVPDDALEASNPIVVVEVLWWSCFRLFNCMPHSTRLVTSIGGGVRSVW